MEDRRFTEIDLRTMLENAARLRPDAAEGRWIVETRFRSSAWEIVAEPDQEARLLVVITA